MSEIIENITDENLFESYFNKFFQGKNCCIRVNDVNIYIEYVQYEGNQIEVKIRAEIDPADKAIIFTRHEDLIIYSQVEYISNENDVYKYKPANIQVMRIPRKEERKQVPKTDGNQPIIISNILSEAVMEDSFKREKKKVEYFKFKIEEKIEGFMYSGVHFHGDKVNDSRMKYFYAERRPIYYPDITDPELKKKDKEKYEFYRSSLYKSDKKIDWDKVVSEISVPLMYKLMIPIGYIQVDHLAPLSNEQFSSLKKLGYTFSELLTQQNIIIFSDDQIKVVDLSKSGIGLLFEQRSLIKHFKDDSCIYFLINLPDGKNVPVYCVVKNVNIVDRKLFRVGLAIKDIDAIGETFYDEYLESIGKPIT